MTTPSIFMSHSSRDKFFVRELATRLEQAGVRVWLDEAEMNIGDSLTQKIGDAILRTDFVAAVLSHNSIASEWVQRELQVALQKEFSGKRVVVLPILLEPVAIPPFLADKLYADFTTPDKAESGIKSILRAVGVSAEVQRTVPQPVASPAAPLKLSEAERRLALFEDLRIVGLDEERSFKPNPQKALYHMYLQLSGQPASEWQQIFDAERRFPRHSMWRRAWIEGAFVIVHCVPDELERHHLEDLKEDVRNANVKFREYLTEQARRQAIEREKGQREQNSIRDLKGRLDFDR